MERQIRIVSMEIAVEFVLAAEGGTQHRSVHSYRKKSEELIDPVIKWNRKKSESDLLWGEEYFLFRKIL